MSEIRVLNPTKAVCVGARVSVQEKRAIEGQAQEAGLTISQFTREALRVLVAMQAAGYRITEGAYEG